MYYIAMGQLKQMRKTILLFAFVIYTTCINAMVFRSIGNVDFQAYRFDNEYFLIMIYQESTNNINYILPSQVSVRFNLDVEWYGYDTNNGSFSKQST